jgi:hypothetical protein
MSENDDEILDYHSTVPVELIHNLRKTANCLYYFGILLFLPSIIRFFILFTSLFRAYGINGYSINSNLPQYIASLKLSLIVMGFTIFIAVTSFLYANQIKALSRNQNVNIGQVLFCQKNYWLTTSVSTTFFLGFYLVVSYSIT